jgi:hypothetical protein
MALKKNIAVIKFTKESTEEISPELKTRNEKSPWLTIGRFMRIYFLNAPITLKA